VPFPSRRADIRAPAQKGESDSGVHHVRESESGFSEAIYRSLSGRVLKNFVINVVRAPHAVQCYREIWRSFRQMYRQDAGTRCRLMDLNLVWSTMSAT